MSSGMRKLILFIVMIGVSYVAYTYMIKPANQNLSERRVKLDKNIQQLDELETANQRAVNLSKQLEELEKAVSLFESKLPSQSEIHKVLEQVTIIAQKKGLQPKTIRTLNQKECNGYIEQPLQMELYGNFNSYYSFLLDLEKLPRITKIRELELKKDIQNDGYANAKFNVSIFFQGQPG